MRKKSNDPVNSQTQESASAPVSEMQTGAETFEAAAGKNHQPESTRQSHPGHGGVWLVILLLIGGVSFIAWKGAQRLDILRSFVEEQSKTQMSDNEQSESRLNGLFAAQKKQNQTELNEFNERLENLSARVLAATSLNRDDYKIYEIDYLLRLANQRILVEREATNALALAESANGVLGELENADLFAARKKLTQEIQALKMASKVDRQGIYLQLQAITQQIENLPLIAPLSADDEDVPPLATDANDEDSPRLSVWQRIKSFGQNAWHKFGGYVRVRDQGRRIDAILPPEDQLYLRQNLRLMLEQAEVGLLREEQQVYEASLEKAEKWIHDYYPLNDQSKAVLNDLETLKKNNIQQPLPDFSGSASLVKDYIHQKDRLNLSRHGGRQ